MKEHKDFVVGKQYACGGVVVTVIGFKTDGVAAYEYESGKLDFVQNPPMWREYIEPPVVTYRYENVYTDCKGGMLYDSREDADDNGRHKMDTKLGYLVIEYHDGKIHDIKLEKIGNV